MNKWKDEEREEGGERGWKDKGERRREEGGEFESNFNRPI